MINKFEKLDVWQRSKDLAIFVYTLTDQYPKTEIFALTSQTNRAVVSVPSNIAEGISRSSVKDLSHFLEIAMGSLFELKTLIEIAFARKYLAEESKQKVDEEIEIIVKQLYSFKRKIHE